MGVEHLGLDPFVMRASVCLEIHRGTDMRCANCTVQLFQHTTTGNSSLYKNSEDLPVTKRDLRFILCEECFLEEDELIEEKGTNDIPSRIEVYFKNVGYDHG